MARLEIGRFAQAGIAHDIEIGVAGEAEAVAESGSAGFFDIDQKFGGVIEAGAGVEGHHARSGFFVVGAEAVLAAVGGVKRRDEPGR